MLENPHVIAFHADEAETRRLDEVAASLGLTRAALIRMWTREKLREFEAAQAPTVRP